eukprot:scaffold25942_cov123-Skeletonema_dohrnii-CCMP3373.AAC.2
MNKKLLVLIAMMLAAASSAAIGKDDIEYVTAEDPTSTSLDEELLDLEYEDEDMSSASEDGVRRHPRLRRRLKGHGGWSTWGTKSPQIGYYGCPPGTVRLSLEAAQTDVGRCWAAGAVVFSSSSSAIAPPSS